MIDSLLFLRPPFYVKPRPIWLLLLCFFTASCGESYEERQARENQQRYQTEEAHELKRKQRLAEFSATYQADLSWRDKLRPDNPLTTVLLQETLIRPDHQAIAVPVRLIDIEKMPDDQYKFLAYASELMHSVMHGQHVVLESRCHVPSHLVSSIQPHGHRLYALQKGDVLLAIRVQGIRQSLNIADTHDGGLEKLHMTFTVDGQCVGLQTVNEDQ